MIAPTWITVKTGQTIQEALLASDYTFVGLEQGFIYEVEGVSGNFVLFYDNGGYDLTAAASEITALCIGVTVCYSPEAMALLRRIGDYIRMDGGIENYPAAQTACQDGLRALRQGDEEAAATALEMLEQAIADYEALMNGPRYTVRIVARQGENTLSTPAVTLTDAYGNETTVVGTEMQVVAGKYQVCVSDGGYNRTEGTVTVTGDAELTVTLPDGAWFGAVRLLDQTKTAYPGTQDVENHTVSCCVPDVAKTVSSVYLNVEQGAVPDAGKTRLRTVYTGTNGKDYSGTARSWNSTATALTYLVELGMKGAAFQLEAQYDDADGYTRIQSYAVTVTRTPTLKSLTVTADGTILPLIFDPTTDSYTLTTVSDQLTIDAEPFAEEYTVTGTGTVETADRHSVTVSAGNVCRTYVLNIQRKEAVQVRLSVPAGVTATVFNSAGSVVAPVNGEYRLIPGETYTCRGTKNTYAHTERTFTAADGLVVSVAEPETTDAITALMLYNGGNAATRTAYPCDQTFSPEQHRYTFTVSDCNTTVYLQASANDAVTAFYTTQTSNAGSNHVEKSIAIKDPVDAAGQATILTQLMAKSGWSNTVLLRAAHSDGDVTWYQEYELTLVRSLHLTELTVSLEDEALPLLDAAGNVTTFNRDTESYGLTVERETTALNLSGTVPNAAGETDSCGGYRVVVNGTVYHALDYATVTLDPEKQTETVTVCVEHTDENSRPTTYQLTVRKTDPVAVTIRTEPTEATVFLTNDLNGKRVLGENGVYLLTPGVSYSYTVTCKGYVGTSGKNVAPETEADWTISLEKAAENTTLKQLPAIWPHLRQNGDNNGVISSPTPIRDETAALYWATSIGEGFDSNACGCPILVDGYLYTYSGTTIYKVDTISGAIVATGEMEHASSFAINPPTYAEGMLFVGLADGTVQAFNAATLESLWIYRDPLGGQPNCSITYYDGYVYTGFWVGETKKANFVCLSATDEDPDRTDEVKLATWTYTSTGGFYWAGAYVCDAYLLVGTDDGASGYTTGKGKLLSIQPKTGELLDIRQMDVVGDIRSSVTCYEGKYYFTNKGGYFFEASVSDSGKIETVRTLKLYNYANDAGAPAMSTCTPTIYNGRAYVGVSGTSQFGAYSGHNITVIDIPNWEIAYTVRTQGYPQTSGVLTTAYQQKTGRVYVYFFDNFTPGKLRVLEDRPGQTSASLVTVESYTDKGVTKTAETAYALFTPVGNQAQYAICSPIVDEYGTIYFKNDSAYLMAVGSAVERLEITQMPEKCQYKAGETFDGTGMKVTAYYLNGKSRDVTAYVTWSEEPLTTDDTDFGITLPYAMYQNRDGETGVDCGKPFVNLPLTIEPQTALGDVNGDGNVSMEDVKLLLCYVNGKGTLTSIQQTAADVSGDSNVNMEDALLILRYINGEIAGFPAEEH